MEIRIVIKHTGTGAVQEIDYALDESVFLGRGPTSLARLEGSLISREHLVLSNADGRIVLRDLSSNGTWVRGERLSRDSQLELKSGDSIELPGYRLEIHNLDKERTGTEAALSSDPANENEHGPKTMLRRAEPVRQFFASLSGLEVFLSFAAICCICVVLFYTLY